MCVYITVVSEHGRGVVVSEDERGVGFYGDVCLHYCCQ